MLVSASWLGDAAAPEGIMLVLSGVAPGREGCRSAVDLTSFPELNPSPVLEVEPSGLVTYANPSAERLLPGLVGTVKDHPFLTGWEAMLACLGPDGPGAVTRKIQCGDMWYQQVWSSVPETGRTRIYSTDITDLELHVVEIARLNRLLIMLSAVNRMGGRMADRQQALDEICHICVEKGGFRLAAVHLVEADGPGLKVAARYAQDAGAPTWATTLIEATSDVDGPSTVAIRTGEHWVTEDLTTVAETVTWQDEALRYGFRSFGAFPLRVEGEVLGCLTLYSEAVEFAHKDELALLDEMAGDVSFILEAIEREERRQHGKVELRESIEQYRGLYDSLPGGVIIFDRTLKIVESNVMAREILGDQAATVVGPDTGGPVWEAIHEDGSPFPGDTQPALVTLRTGESIRGVVMGLLSHNGEPPRWILVSSEPLRDTGTDDVEAVLIHFADITDVQLQVIETARLNRILAMLSAVNRMGGRMTNQQQTLDEICHICVNVGGFSLAVVRMIGPDDADLKVAAYSGRNGPYLEWATTQIDAAGDEDGPSRIATRTGEHWVTDDVATAPEMAERRQEALARGFRSLGAFPLRVEGEVVGCVVLYSDTVGFTLEDELRILDEMAGDVSFILEAIERDENRRQLETQRNLTTGILAIINKPGSPDQAMERVLTAVKTYTGFDAVGIRLQSGDDFPYAAQQGFSEDFLLTEDTLTERDSAGGVCRDKDGNVRLKGTCGLVLSGDVPSSHPLFTAGGSFWTNDSLPLLDLPPDEDPRHRPRNECLHQGYASVVLIPLRAEHETVGLLQLNDKRPGCLTLELVHFLEGLGSTIGVALAHKRSAAALERNRHLLAETEQMGKVGGWEIGTDTGILTWTEEVYRIHEMAPSYAPTAEEAVAFYTPTSRPIIEQAVREAIEQGKPYDVELEIITAKGNLRIVHTLGRADLEHRRVQGLFQDITERRQAEDALRDSEELYRRIVQDQTEMICRSLPDGTITFINDAYRRFYGRSREDIIGSSIYSLIPEEGRAEVAEASARLTPLQDTAEVELFITCPDGLSRWTRWVHRNFFDDAGRLVETQATGSDITALRAAQEGYRLAAVGQLAAGVAHDFNNLLLAMGGTAQMVEMGRCESARLVDIVLKSTRRGAEITKNLMAFARPEEPRREVGHLETSLDAALAVASRQLANAEIGVLRQYPFAVRSVVFDAGQMEQVFLNLTINASHAMPRGGTLTISTEYPSTGPDAGQAVVRVSDTGSGIAPEHLDHIFEPFFTTKGRLGESETPGSGLGLSVSYGLVTAHGGTITVSSEVGAGTTFEIRLPLTEETATAEEPEDDTTMAREAMTALKGARVLVAEDETDVLLLLRQLFETVGSDLVTAATAGEAIEALRREQFDLVLSDLMMPGGGGRAVVEFSRSMGDEAPPVVIMTGRLERALHDEVMALGAARSIEKPFDMGKLLRVLAEVLRSRGR